MRLKGKAVVVPLNRDPSRLIGLALTKANEDAAVLASSYQKDHLKKLTAGWHKLPLCKSPQHRWKNVYDNHY
ncbi:hypothetical protein EVAR_5813_1 [Eumeta japonica]|uniref:Uncharacterized protein n=1 Tax=Eumeta variegata TaxID=151549 RepID=A0A4C1T4F4_EUMVA|nr:hypothetical protein EVAR_5813_1 [Eumeta japonica]